MTDTKRPKVATYRPDVFDGTDIDSAMRIILTEEAGTTTEERWQRETPYLVNEIGRALELDAQSRVLDYGCGIGRIAKGLIDRYGCRVDAGAGRLLVHDEAAQARLALFRRVPSSASVSHRPVRARWHQRHSRAHRRREALHAPRQPFVVDNRAGAKR